MKARILVVEQEKSLSQLLHSKLVQDGHEVWFAANRDEAQPFFVEGRELNILILELNAHPSSGFAWVKQLNQSHPHVKIIVTTQNHDSQLAVKAFRCGVSDFFEKPFDLGELSEAVSRCYDKYLSDHSSQELIKMLQTRLQEMEARGSAAPPSSSQLEGQLEGQLQSQPEGQQGQTQGPLLRLVRSDQNAIEKSDLSFTQYKRRWSDTFEQEYLVSILNRNHGNVSAAAREAKLDRSNFLRLLRRHHLNAQNYRKAA